MTARAEWPGNLFANLPERLVEERFDDLLRAPGLRVERIVSTGQHSPPGFWYDQDWSEWVVVLSGSAVVEFADTPDPVPLGPGDHVTIPAHRRHRVAATDPTAPTVWLAVHFGLPG